MKEIVKKAPVLIDTKGGSLSYNRTDMQISQTLHMAIELYPNLNYLFILDHYDDIALFDNDVSPETVSYYQVKTNEESISIDTAISKEWTAKLYEHLSNPEWIVNELGLITNCPLKIVIHYKDDAGKKHTQEKNYTAEKTAFTLFNETAIKRIKEDIANRKGIAVDDVDLSKFVHMRTTLSIPKHREIVEQEMGSFLQQQYPKITVDSVKTIYCTMMDLLTKRQSYELLDKDAPFSVVRSKKGMSKSDFTRVIDEAMLISIPPFEEILYCIGYDDECKNKAAYEYTRLLADFHSKPESFTSIFLKTRKLCLGNTQTDNETMQEYCHRIYSLLPAKSPIYNETYISVLTVSIQINEWRRAQ